MRDLSEYKAEIFRRSEEKIRERKKLRNRAFAFCIPLCLVFAAIAFAKLPEISASDISTESVSSDSSLSQIVIQDNLEELSNTFCYNVEESPETWNLIRSAFEADNQEVNKADDQHYTETTQTVVQDSLSLFSNTKYEIVFTNKDGEVFSYTLDGNKLIDNTTNKKVTLSSEQVFELQSKLGITIKWEEEK